MESRASSEERSFQPISGFLMLLVELLLLGSAVTGFALRTPPSIIAAIGAALLFALFTAGFFVVDPNHARVLVLFGRYRGSVREMGFFWTNPFTIKRRLSLRANNFNSDKLKVNDLLGNPIEIAAVVVWLIRDTAQATFDVEKYENFIRVQSEAAVRLVTSRHPYDDDQHPDIVTTLRGSSDVMAEELKHELQQRLDRAGIEVIEARLSHLAYAPEIASAMLQRQQAQAIIAARQKIVEGAVGMVEMALHKLSEKREVIDLDNERKATLVGNLLVVLWGRRTVTGAEHRQPLHLSESWRVVHRRRLRGAARPQAIPLAAPARADGRAARMVVAGAAQPEWAHRYLLREALKRRMAAGGVAP
ncbi:MAG: SPFH domain-containing protein [Planctomycetota bacterium]